MMQTLEAQKIQLAAERAKAHLRSRLEEELVEFIDDREAEGGHAFWSDYETPDDALVEFTENLLWELKGNTACGRRRRLLKHAKAKPPAAPACPGPRPLMATLRSAGLSYKEIAAKLNADGVNTVRGGRCETRDVKRVMGRRPSVSKPDEDVA
jgi:hypothetical protein